MKKLALLTVMILVISIQSVVFAQSKIIDIPDLYQYPELPQGCEITSLTAVLNYYGEDIDKVTMAERFLPQKDFYRRAGRLYGPNPFTAYAGNPRKHSGWFCYAEPIVTAANNYFQSKELFLIAENFTGKTKEDIIEELNMDHPVIVWVTIDLQNVRYTTKWYFEDSDARVPVPRNLHCVVLKDIEGDIVQYMDPINGSKTATTDKFFKRYYDLGGHAAVIRSIADTDDRLLTQSSPTDLLYMTTEGSSFISWKEKDQYSMDQIFVSVKLIHKIKGFEWVESFTGEEIYIYADEAIYTFTKNSLEAFKNEQSFMMDNPVIHMEGNYYIPYSTALQWLDEE